MNPVRRTLAGLTLGMVMGLPFGFSADLTIAAAANLSPVMPALVAAFGANHPDWRIDVVPGATGNLVAQIRRGAPYDLLLAADERYPRALVTSGDAVADSYFIYARGRLVLWPAPDSDWRTALGRTPRERIAIANPDTAPYGAAARAMLIEAGVWDAWQPRLVIAENVAQVAQWVNGRHAAYGFVAASQLLDDGWTNRRGEARTLPDAPPLPQAAVLLTRAATSTPAQAFLSWLSGTEAQAIFTTHGYDPAPGTP